MKIPRKCHSHDAQISRASCVKLGVAWCYFFCGVFSPLSIAISSLGEERELILMLFVRMFVCSCLVLSVFSSSCCLGRAVACDCGTPLTFLLAFLLIVVADLSSA